MDYYLNLITAPAYEPITLSQARLWLKIPDNITADDDIITKLIKYARQYIERYSKRALFTQTWEMVFNCSPHKIDIPLGQLQSVTSVTVIAEDGTESVQSTDLYHTSLDNDSGRVWLKVGSSWGTTSRAFDNFKVRFVCGWDNLDDIPDNYITAIKDIITYAYENRGYRDSDMYVLCQQNAVGRLRML